MTPSQAHKPAHGGYPGRVLSLGEMLTHNFPRQVPFASLGKAKADAQRDAQQAAARFERAQLVARKAAMMNTVGDLIEASPHRRLQAAMLLDQGD